MNDWDAISSQVRRRRVGGSSLIENYHRHCGEIETEHLNLQRLVLEVLSNLKERDSDHSVDGVRRLGENLKNHFHSEENIIQLYRPAEYQTLFDDHVRLMDEFRRVEELILAGNQGDALHALSEFIVDLERHDASVDAPLFRLMVLEAWSEQCVE